MSPDQIRTTLEAQGYKGVDTDGNGMTDVFKGPNGDVIG
jgi:hypothetical protein